MKRNVHKVIISAMILHTVCFLLGCKDIEDEKSLDNPIETVVEENQIEDNEDTSMKVTMEYVCKEYNMDESDFEGVDFEDFVNEFNLKYEKIKKENVKVLLQCYKEDYGKVKTPDYRQVFAMVNEAKLTEENQDTIAIVLLSQIKGEEHHYHIFDFEIGKIIIGEGSESTILEDEIVGEADEQVKEEIIKLFEEYDAYSWKQSNDLKSEINIANGEAGTTTSWSFKVKFSDNTIYRIHGDTFTDETAPESFDLFVNDLKALATSSSEE